MRHLAAALLGCFLLCVGCAPSPGRPASSDSLLRIGTEPALHSAVDRAMTLYEVSHSDISIRVDTRGGLVEALESGQLDAIFIIDRVTDNEIIQAPVGYVDIALVVTEESPLSNITAEDLSIMMKYGVVTIDGDVFSLLIGSESTSTYRAVSNAWHGGQHIGSSAIVFPDEPTMAGYLLTNDTVIALMPDTLRTDVMRQLTIEGQQTVLTASVMILFRADSGRPEQLLLNWLLSDEGQSALGAFITPLN